jgi:hypothetical protein
VDNTPPQIVISGAVDTKYYNTDVTLGVVVTDTNMDKTTVTLNGSVYVSGTPVQTDGIYTLAVLASDKAGNTAQQVIHFVVDKTMPAVVVTGVQNNSYYNTDVIPVIAVTDVNLSTTTITLNGLPFVSGTTVSKEGAYRLNVTATDLAGNVNTTVVQFTIDKTPPTLSVTSPVDGATVAVNVVNVQGLTEAGASVTLSMGTYQVTLNANSQGQFTFVQIPLLAGVNSLKVSARDLAGNNSPTVVVAVTLQATNGETHGDIVNSGRVLVWLPLKPEQECEPLVKDDSHKTGSGYRNGGLVEDCSKSHQGAKTDDPYAQLIALIDSTLRTDGADYRVVRNKDDFVTALRSRRYTTLLLGELQTATNAQSLALDDDLAAEIQSTVASGVGLTWIKTHPNDIGGDDAGNSKPTWEKFFGAKITGVLPHLTQLELTNSASSQIGTWAVQSSFGLQVQGQGGILVGKLTPGNKPALVLNSYGKGSVALVDFDPSAIADPQGAISTLHNILQFAVPVSTTLLPSAPTEIRWDASKLNPPLDVRFEEHLSPGMSFLELSGGQILSDKEAVWEQHLDINHTTFDALVRLPGSVGTFETSSTLLNKQGSNLSPIVSNKLTVSVTADRKQLGVQIMDTLNSLVVSTKEKKILVDTVNNVQEALIRPQAISDDILFSIDKLAHAEVLIASLAGDHTELLSKIGLLMTTYQLAWVESVKTVIPKVPPMAESTGKGSTDK